MEKIILKGNKREVSELAKGLIASKLVPCVVYGHKKDTVSLKLGSSDVLRAYRMAGENHIIQLEFEGKKLDVLFHDIQKAPVSGNIIHVDFYAITKGEKVHTHIPLRFVGISKAKIEENAVIEELIKQIEVKCFPDDLVDDFEIDLSKLEKTGDNIKISDLIIPSKIEILSSLDEVIAVAAKTKVEKISDEKPVDVLPEEDKKENKENNEEK